MSLADEINAIPIIVTGNPRCATCVWLTHQDDAVRDAFHNYIDQQDPDNPSWDPLYKLCKANGLSIASRTFREHINCRHGR